jgi:hypothetical protein
MAKVRPYLDENLQMQMAKLYPTTKTEMLDRVVQMHLTFRKLVLRNIKGVFSCNELTGIVASFNGTIINFDLGIPPKFMLTAGMEDSISLDGNDRMYDYEAEPLLEKIAALSELDAMFLLEEVSRFWNESRNPELEDFIKQF